MKYSVLKNAPVVLAVVVGVFGVTHGAMAQALEQSDCSTLDGEAAASCREVLRGNASPSVFLRLGELLLEKRDFLLAVKVYRQGVRTHRNNSELQAKLTVAESQLDEAQWIEMRRQESSAQAEAAVKAEIFKCTRLAESAPQTALKACETALEAMPDDPELLEAKGDALRKMDSGAEAYLAYAAAARRASSPALEEKLTALGQYKPKPTPVVKAEPEPVEAEPEPVEAEPEPVEAEPEPAEAEPEPVEAEPEPVETETAESSEEAPIQTATATPPAAPESEARNGADTSEDRSNAEEQDADQGEVRDALIRTVNDRSKGLDERLEARNTLMSMAHQGEDPS